MSNIELSEFFLPSLSSGERAQRAPFSLLFVCQSELTELFAEDTDLAGEISFPKQDSRNSIPPVQMHAKERKSAMRAQSATEPALVPAQACTT